MPFLACELAEVAVFAESEGVIRFVFVVAVVRQLCATVAVIARLAESFGVEWLVTMRARVHCFLLALMLLGPRHGWFHLIVVFWLVLFGTVLFFLGLADLLVVLVLPCHCVL